MCKTVKHVDQELQNATKVLVRNDGYKPLLAMRYLGAYTVIEKHHKYLVILNRRSIERSKRFIERNSAEDSVNAEEDSKRSTTIEDGSSPTRRNISTLNPSAPPWFPAQSSRGRSLKPTLRLIYKMR